MFFLASIVLSWNMVCAQKVNYELDSCCLENFKWKYIGEVVYENEITSISQKSFQARIEKLYTIMRDSSLTEINDTRELILTMNLLLFTDSTYSELLFQKVKKLKAVEEMFYSYYLNYLKCSYPFYQGKCGGTDFRYMLIQYGGLYATCSMYYVEGISNFTKNNFIARDKTVSSDIILR
jgi:hypothetical protein